MTAFLPIASGETVNFGNDGVWRLVHDVNDPGNSFLLSHGLDVSVGWAGTVGDTLGPLGEGYWNQRMRIIELPEDVGETILMAARHLRQGDRAWIRYAARQWEKLTGQKPENP